MTAPYTPVLVSAWACVCQRKGCRHRWVSTCGCFQAGQGEAVDPAARIHREGCEPPPRCPGCKAPNWWRPAGKVGRPRLPKTD